MSQTWIKEAYKPAYKNITSWQDGMFVPSLRETASLMFHFHYCWTERLKIEARHSQKTRFGGHDRVLGDVCNISMRPRSLPGQRRQERAEFHRPRAGGPRFTSQQKQGRIYASQSKQAAIKVKHGIHSLRGRLI